MQLQESGGEGGIRTPGRGFSPYNGLANRRIQPLCHLSATFEQTFHPNDGVFGEAYPTNSGSIASNEVGQTAKIL